MKVEFKDIFQIKSGDRFFLYGNYKKSFELFCNYINEISLIQKLHLQMIHCSVSEYLKMQRDQDDLFDNDIKCFCMRNVEDKHLELVLGLNHSNNIFILESGDYFKSKKITSELQKDQKFYAIASFNNDITLMSICKMLLPQQSQQIHNEIIKIIKVTDEGLVSLFRKISLLLDENAFQNLKNYITYKRSFIDELELIPLVRYALQAAIKEEVFHQDQSYTKMNLKNKIHFLMNVERRQKRMYMLNRNYVLHELQYNK